MFGKIVTISVITMVVLHLYNLLNMLDVWKKVQNKGTRDCYNIPGIKYGSEDIHVIPEKNVAIVSSGVIPIYPPDVFLIRLDDFASLTAVPFSFEPSFDKGTFHPHGLYVKQSRKGPYHLYVVNHQNEQECVDVFEIDLENVKLAHVRRITDLLVKNAYLNDLVVVDDFVFYGTVSMTSRSVPVNSIQLFLMLPVGFVIFHDNGKTTPAVKNLFIPNGIAISPDNKVVYIGLSGSKAVATYSRKADNTLEFLKQYNAESFVDNIHYSPSNGSSPDKLWFAGPYRALNSLKRNFGIDPAAIVPSHFGQFTVEPDGSLANMQENFVDDGHFVSGISQVVGYENYVLIGTVDAQILVCKAPS